MAQNTLFARAWPSGIQLTETCSYRTEVSHNPDTDQVEAPSGRIEVLVPLDGYRSFGSTAVDDIEHQLAGSVVAPSQKARIGYLAVTDHDHVDLEDRLAGPEERLAFARSSVLPLEVPLAGEGLVWPAGLTDDRHTCQIGFDYSFRQTGRDKWPETIPLEITVNILDEDIIREETTQAEMKAAAPAATQVVTQAGSPAAAKQSLQVLEDLARDQVAQAVDFRRSLMFRFVFKLLLPAPIGTFPDHRPNPRLVSMALEWPVAASPRAVHLLVGDSPEEGAVVYNAERRVIEWGGIELEAKGAEGSRNLFSYVTRPVWLLVDSPGELYLRDRLQGMAIVEMERPLSGIDLQYFNAVGKPVDVPITRRTVLTSDLTLYLEECFDTKTLSPYQHLQFEDVILEANRVADIVTELRDEGFEPWSVELAARGNTRRYLLYGERSEGPSKLLLWMLLEGTKSSTERRRQVSGGQMFTTTFETGNISMYMRGQFKGESARLVGVMNQIQSRLKYLFERRISMK